jgi:hypothetical protein
MLPRFHISDELIANQNIGASSANCASSTHVDSAASKRWPLSFALISVFASRTKAPMADCPSNLIGVRQLVRGE